MNATIADYTLIETVKETATTRLYRGVKKSDSALVIIKTLKIEYPTIEQLSQFRYEYRLLKLLDIEGVIKPLALESYRNGLALILENFVGEPLKKIITHQSLNLKLFLKIAIQLASTLAQLHHNRIIHKDLKPDHILVNLKTEQVKIIDLSISSCLSTETLSVNNPTLLEGTLSYMSPEQTGRMNRSIDYRTDFYSLGVTLYEMLSGQLPFQSIDPLELIHCHIAKTPVPPNQIKNIPSTVSHIITKLLAKTAEERYQSALGLKADLEKCLRQLQKNGKIEDFKIGQLDNSSQFVLPQKLYGREKEVTLLMDAFKRVNLGASELMLVSGYSGIGKSSLVNEIHKLIIEARGYFISGKFDQFKRNIPYASLIQAFQELMRQFLTESPEKIVKWKLKLKEALGSNGQVIIDVIPEVELIIGPQPPVPHLGSPEAQYRFNQAFHQFIHVLTQSEHPLVLFLDDLQWADSDSLKLIELLMCDSKSQYLLLIAAYRDNEVRATHPLMLMLDNINSFGAKVNKIVLNPLQIDHVNQLVKDTVHSTLTRTQALTELIFKKAGGNPFFLTQLLKSLYQEKILSFNFTKGFWQWDINKLQEIEITDNVIELMVGQIQKLSIKTQNILKLAACIGDKFTLDILSIVYEKPPSETASDLWESLQAGLIIPLSEAYKIALVIDSENSKAWPAEFLKVEYKFLHDRVQQAAYSLIPDSDKKVTHLKIGQLLRQNTTIEEQKENIFALVNQFNYGIDLLTIDSEKSDLAQLNLIAGQKAKTATAYESAMGYLNLGLSLLTDASWNQQYELTLALHQEAAETAFLSGSFEQMEQLTKIVLQQAQTLLDKVKVYEIRIKSCEVQRRLLSAVTLGLQVLEMLDIQLPSSPTLLNIEQAVEETSANLAQRTIEELLNLPLMTDVNKLAALRIIASLIPAVYQSTPELFILMVCQEVNLSIKYGNTKLSASGFADYALFLSGVIQDIESGYKFGQLALNLILKLNAREVKSQTLFKVGTFTIYWKYHLKETLSLLDDAYSSGLENGDLAHAGYAASHKCQYLYWCGLDLKSLEPEMANYSKVIAQIHQETALKWHQIFHQTILNLLEVVENPCCLMGKAYNEEELLALHIQANERTILHYVYLNKLILCYLFGDFAQAVENATEGKQYLDGVTGLITVPLFYFYDSLTQLAIYRALPSSQPKKLLTQVNDNQEKMRKWADHAPMNFQHKYELIEAEKARVLGQYRQATDFYESAIAGAKEHGYIQEEALSNELAAEFYFERKRNNIARDYLTQSYYLYVQWGATNKLKQLESKYPQIFARESQPRVQALNKQSTLSPIKPENLIMLDIATVMKASQALSSEIFLDNLLKKLMQILLENAGARTGFLILEKADNFFIEATGNVELNEISVQQSIPVEETSDKLPLSIINYVCQTQENIVLNDARKEGFFRTDSYIINQQPKSVLCIPILHHGKLIGILYLENNLTPGAFTPERVEVLQLLSSQAAISIENARLYQDLALANANLQSSHEQLEAKVKKRTQQLEEKNLQLEQEVRERQRAEEIAEAANRAKSEFLANMSHELRTPLNGILGYTQICKKDKNLSPQQKNRIEIIHQCGEHLLTLINDILDVSKIEARKMELYPTEFYFSEFLKGIIEICFLKAEQKGISLIFAPLSLLPKIVQADEKRLRQILINLLNNAVKFTEKGSITFKVSYHKGKARFEVEDTGIGIAPEQLEKIFLPFQQAGDYSRKVEGTGLGLSISRQLAQMMGGTIDVKSIVGKGSTFCLELELPEVALKTELKQVLDLNITGFKGSKEKLLIVDDKWTNRSVLINLLKPLGFNIEEATDGIDALNKAVKFKPDAVLMDLVMPNLDGFEATRQLRQLPQLKDVVVIATSASVFNFDQQESLNVGCNDFLSKPITEADLLEKLRKHLGLEWVYERNKEKRESGEDKQPAAIALSSHISIPPAEEIAALLDLAKRGDLRGIIHHATQLEQINSQWKPFTTYLCQLAKEFKGKQIREYLKQFS